MDAEPLTDLLPDHDPDAVQAVAWSCSTATCPPPVVTAVGDADSD